MATATERIPVLVTPCEKALIAEKAKAAGVSMGDILRRGAASFSSVDDEKLLAGMIEQVLKSTESASRAIDDALDFIAASNERIDALEAQDKMERMAATMKGQQVKIEGLTERVIRLETAQVIALSQTRRADAADRGQGLRSLNDALFAPMPPALLRFTLFSNTG